MDSVIPGLRFPAHALDEILRSGNQLGFLTADQIVATLMKGISHFAGKSKELPIVLVGKIGGDDTSALGLGLNDNRSMRQTRNDAIANQEVFAVKLFFGGKLRNKPPLPEFYWKSPCARGDKFDPTHGPYKLWSSNWI